MLKQIQQWLFPNICCLCGNFSEAEIDLCWVCKGMLPEIEDRCFRCALPLGGASHSICCQRCLENPPPFDRICALFRYEPPVTKLITGLKFAEKLVYGKVLGHLLAGAVTNYWYKDTSLPDAIIPMPLHKNRLRQRGYNQAVELLWPLHKTSKIPVLFDACTRVRKTFPQSQLNRNRRKRNMMGVFKIDIDFNVRRLEHVAIMDDVVTTASTAAALCRVLKESGIQQVDVWCICRA